MAITISGRNACINDMPAALMAVSSLLSPRFPKAISDDSNIASGKACGISIRPIYQKNCAITSMVSPFPMRSSTYRHRNCIISTNWQMKNVPAKSRANCLTMNMSSFFILNIISVQSYCKKLRLHSFLIDFIFLPLIYSPLARCSLSRLLSHRIFRPSTSSSSAKSVIRRFRW